MVNGIKQIAGMRPFAEEILEKGSYQTIGKTRYVNDKQITDHYAIIPKRSSSSSISWPAFSIANIIEPEL